MRLQPADIAMVTLPQTSPLKAAFSLYLKRSQPITTHFQTAATVTLPPAQPFLRYTFFSICNAVYTPLRREQATTHSGIFFE